MLYVQLSLFQAQTIVLHLLSMLLFASGQKLLSFMYQL